MNDFPISLPEKKAKGDIYVIDDDPDAVNIFQGFLGAEGYRVAVETDPVRAMKKDLPFVPEVILMDVLMPKVSGLALTKLIKESFSGHTIRIIMVTGVNKIEVVERAALAGADDFLTKPIRREELLNRVERQIQSGRAEEALRVIQRVLASEAPTLDSIGAIRRTLENLGLASPAA